MKVKSGLEVLLHERLDLLRDARVGVIVNASSVDANFDHLVDLFHRHPAIDLRAIFGPQHGFRGETQDNMIEWRGYQDPVTGLPIYSLYGETRQPTAQALDDLDLLVFDIQDVGARYYTFIYTMALAMQACRSSQLRMVVLDRPNPINGAQLEGPVLDRSFSSFVGLYPLPIRHGMTVAELAGYFNRLEIGCELEIVPMRGWSRSMFFDETGLPWVLPSPNLPTLDSALVYPGLCLLEGTNVSEGRGTTRPFELTGAPWVEPTGFAARLNALQLPGVRFRPVEFIPTFHKWQEARIGGVQIHVTDRSSFLPFRCGLALLKEYQGADPDRFHWNDPPYEYEEEKLPIDILCGTDRIRSGLDRGVEIAELEASWEEELASFRTLREEFLLYSA